MSFISQNLKTLRKIRGVTQQQFADSIGIKRSLVGAYEEGRAEPNITNLIAFAEFFGITVDTLISTPVPQDHTGIKMKEADVKGTHLRVLSVTTDRDDNEKIQLVPQKAAAGYTNGYSDPEFVSELPEVAFPNLGSGSFRAFEISGDSMLPLSSGTVIIGKYLENWNDIKENETYIIITNTEGVVYKRVRKNEEDNSLQLISDNPSYSPYSVSLEDIHEIWQAKAFVSTHFPSPELDVNRLGSMVMDLQQEINKLKSK